MGMMLRVCYRGLVSDLAAPVGPRRGIRSRGRRKPDDGTPVIGGPFAERRMLRPSRFELAGAKTVADVADGFDEGGVTVLDLSAEPADVDINGPGAAVEVVAPNFAEKGLAGEDAPAVGGEKAEELVLLVSEFDGAPADVDGIVREVHDEVANGERVSGIDAMAAIERPAYAGAELFGRRAGDEKVVGNRGRIEGRQAGGRKQRDHGRRFGSGGRFKVAAG